MKKHVCSLTLALLAAGPLACFGQGSLENDPAYLPIDKMLDLKTIQPEVNVNLPRFLLKDAASELSSKPGDPLAGSGIDIADLIKDIKLIRVVVIDANDKNRAALADGVKGLRATLESKWTPIVSVPGDNVGVYALGDPAGESMAGLAVLIFDGGDAVIANVVGRVSVGKLIKLASKMDKIPKDLLKKLGAATNQTSADAGQPPKESGSSDAKEKKPADNSSDKAKTSSDTAKSSNS